MLVLVLAAPNLSLGRVPLPEWSSSDEKKYAEPGSAPLGVGLWPEAVLEGGGAPFPGAVGNSGGSSPVVSQGGKRPVPVFRTIDDGNGVATPPTGPIGVIEFTPMQQVSPTVEIRVTPGEPPISPAETRKLYFAQRPLDFLVDPMALLTEQKSNDVSRFLEYHSEGAPFDICLMVLRENERVPNDLSLAAMHREWFGEERVALVVYPLGHPRQIVFEFGESVRQLVSGAVLGRIEQSCIAEAVVGHDPSDQVEQLAIEMSIRLYWLSRILDRPESMSEEAAAAAADRLRADETALAGGEEPGLPWAWVFLIALFTVALGGGIRWLARRNSLLGGPVFFPDRELPVRLGGASSGGACAEMSFQFGSSGADKGG